MQTCAKAALAALAFLIISCGGSSDDICGCQPSESASADYRHAAKHVPLPAMVPQEITVHDMLAWTRPPEPPSDALRGGRELKLFHIAHAFVQFVWLFHGDCDIHVEIADTPDKTAPRVIVETPLDSEYCSARRSLQSGLARRGIRISEDFQELPQPVPAEVLGLAFQDFNHKRGSDFVATVWELHPATVNLLP
jgi:hypothetical protein